jgi:hypothetical protein
VFKGKALDIASCNPEEEFKHDYSGKADPFSISLGTTFDEDKVE